MKKIKYCLTILVIGCASPERIEISDPKILQRQLEQCIVDTPASADTQNNLWKPIWNEDQNAIEALANGTGLRSLFTLNNAVSVENKDFQILISNLDMIRIRQAQGDPNRQYLGDRDYFELLFLKNVDGTNPSFQIEIHQIDNQEDLLRVYEEARSETKTLKEADFPTTKKEACYTIITDKIEPIAVTMNLEKEGEDWQDPEQIRNVFQNRRLLLTTTYGAWKATDQGDLNVETAMYLELVDTTTENRDPVTLSFKQPNDQFNDPQSELAISEITGLNIPYFDVSFPMIGRVSPNNDLGNEIINAHIKRKTLNPFEVVFGFSGESNNGKAHFTFNITKATHTQANNRHPTNPSARENDPPSPTKRTASNQVPPMQTNEDTLQASVNFRNESASEQPPETQQPESSNQSPPSVASNQNDDQNAHQIQTVTNPPPTLITSQPDSYIEVEDPLIFPSCHDPSHNRGASFGTLSYVWQAIQDTDQATIKALVKNRTTYTLSNSVQIPSSNSNLNDWQVLIADNYLRIPRRHIQRVRTETFDVLYIQPSTEQSTLHFELHKVNQADFLKIYELLKGDDTLIDYQISQREACYTVKLERMSVDTVIQASSNDSHNDVKPLLEDRMAYITASYGSWKATDTAQELNYEVGLHIQFEDMSDEDRSPFQLMFKQNDNPQFSFPKPRIIGLSIPFLSILTDSLDDEISFEYLQTKVPHPSEIIFGFSIRRFYGSADFTATLKPLNI